MIDFSAARTKMVDSQIRTEEVTDYAILDAMGAVPRERFVPERLKSFAYLDEDLLLAGSGETARYLLRAAAFARLIQLAGIEPADRVLDVGSGMGYAAAVLSRLAVSVVALESDGALAAEARKTLDALGIGNVAVATGPLTAGRPADGPFDVIVLEGAVDAVPDALFAQLGDGGRLVAVVGRGHSAAATVYTRTDDDIGGRPAFNVNVRALPGFERPKAFVF